MLFLGHLTSLSGRVKNGAKLKITALWNGFVPEWTELSIPALLDHGKEITVCKIQLNIAVLTSYILACLSHYKV